MNKPLVHSYTSLKEFQQCPRKYYENRILKRFPYVQSESAKWGDYVHKCLEDYIKDGTPLPQNVSMYQGIAEAARVKGYKRLVEHQQGITKDMRAVGFWGNEETPWLRGKIDYLAFVDEQAVIEIDWKTGKNIKYADPDQIDLMSLLVFAEFPDIQEVRGALMYVEIDDAIEHTVRREDVPRLLNKWTKVSDRIELTLKASEGLEEPVTAWQERKTPLCGWCPVTDCANWYDGPAKKRAKSRN